MRGISLDELIAAEHNLALDREDSYLISYPEFVRFFRELDLIDRHHLIIGAHLVYGWMPTILRFKSIYFDQVARMLNDVKAGRRLGEDELDAVKELINNSMVGTSKLLHFVNPHLYPIWDSRISRFITGKAYHYFVNDVASYLAYLAMCQTLVQDARFPAFHRSVEHKLGYAVSPLRAVELVIYTTAQGAG